MSQSVTATFLFTDLVGSTQLASSMSAVQADEVRRRHFALLRAAVESTGGREVKNLGDGLMIVFSSASRAFSCAVEIQQALDRHNRRGDTVLEVRIGLATGEAIEEEGDFFGDPVVEAARLCALAAPGQILATELLRLTVGRHTSLEFSPLGPLELKGLPAPVPAVEARWEPAREDGPAGVPLPARLAQYASGGLFGFSGRDPELARLTELRKQASTERRLGVALVAGEPGVGKSCLAAHAAQGAHGEGVTVLFGECAEGSHAPYLPWMGALSHLVRHAEPTTLERLSPVHAWALGRLLPAEAGFLPAQETVEAEADTEQFLLVQAVAAALELASANAPVLIVLDDLQWADSSSLSLLRHLLGTGGHMGCLIVGTYRPSDLGPGHPLAVLLADLHREPAAHRIDLGGLGDHQILELIETAAGYEMDEAGVALAHALRRETDGNPFFVAELLRHLVESGAIAQDASGRYSLTSDLDELALPQSIRDVIGQRVARLGPDVHRTLTTASVIGRTFDLDVLSAVAGADPDDVLDIVETAATATLLEESDRAERYRFSHALIQHALYSELSAARRQRTHLRVAEVLEASASGAALDAAQLSELARHWQAAVKPTDAAKAITYTRQAAAAAMAALAPADAARLYLQVLELLERDTTGDDRPARVEVLLELARARLAYNHTEGIETLRQAAALGHESGDPELLIACALTRVPNQNTSQPGDPVLLDVLHHALEALGPNDHARRARVLAALVDETDPERWQERRDYADAAVAAAAAADDDSVTLEVTVATGYATSAEHVVRFADQAEAALHIAERGHDPVALSSALGVYGAFRLALGDVEATRAAVGRSSELAEDFGMAPLHIGASNFRSALQMLDGDLDALQREADLLYDYGSRGFPDALATYAAVLFELRWLQGRLAEYLDQFPDGGISFTRFTGFRPALVTALLAVGDAAKAREVFEIDAASSFREYPHDAIWPNVAVLFAGAAVDLGDQAAARALYLELAPHAQLYGSYGPLFYGQLERPLGRLAAALGDAVEAEERLRRALEAHRRIGAPYWIATNALDLVEVLASTTPESHEIDALRQEAARLAGRHGFGGLQQRLDRM